MEYRSRPTRVIGERFHIYAPLKHATPSAKVWSRDLAVPAPPHAPPPPLWLLELAGQLRLIEPGTPLPTGVIVGSAVIEKVSRVDSVYGWHLAGARRARKLRKPDGHPQPVWFRPF